MRRFGLLAVLLTAGGVTGLVAEQAAADGFWVTAARGLQFAGWAPPTGEIGYRQHIVGDGWNFQTTRVLNDWELDSGVAGFEFTGLGQQVRLDTELSVRRAVIPTAKFRIATDQGGTDNPFPIAYRFWAWTGAENIEIEGQGALEAELDINALGFYEIDAFITNRGTFDIDGVLYDDNGSLDYDLGPVSLSGNVFVDLLAAVTAPLFANAGTTNPLAVFSGRAKLQNQIKERDELLARLEAGEVLTDAEMSRIINTSVLESVFAGQGSDLLDVTSGMLKSAVEPSSGLAMMPPPTLTPEPGAVVSWLALAAAAGLRRRR